MLSILGLTTPIYLAILVGYLAVRGGLFAREQMRVLTQFVLTLGLPCLLFGAIATRRVGEILNPTYLAAYALATLLTFGLGVLYGRARGAPWAMTAFDGLGFAGANSGYVGYPLALLVLPQVAGLSLGLNMLVENILVLPLMFALAGSGSAAEHGWRAQVRQTARRLSRNPMIIAVVLAVAVSAIGLGVPEVLTRTLDLFGKATTAVALFAVGGLLTGVRLSGYAARILVVTTGKLVVHPVMVVGALAVAAAVGMPPLAPDLRVALILTCALPVMSLLPMVAHEYGEEGPAAATLLASTAASFVTLSWLIHVLVG
ncbi:MAG: AEC family transporter [Dermatophilaceae bacterium]